MAKLEFDVLIVGAGFAGLSTAYYLAKNSKLKVAVVDRERRLGVHASGNNAGMVRQAVTDTVTAALAVEGKRLMAAASFKKVVFKPNGSLLLSGSAAASTEIWRTKSVLKSLNVNSQIWEVSKAIRHVPILRRESFKEALFCPSDGLVNPQILLEAFRREALGSGVRFFAAAEIGRIERLTDGFDVLAGEGYFKAKRIVNAAGAWTHSVARQAGAQVLPFKAYRRHLFESLRSKTYHNSWPFVWDLTGEFYFRPGRPGCLILSPCDKSSVPIPDREKGGGDLARGLLRAKLKRFGGELATLRLARVTSGLRTMVPDGRFVIGEDGQTKGFYWVAGLGGHGLTASFSVGKLAANLILNKKTDPTITKAVSPNRFNPVG